MSQLTRRGQGRRQQRRDEVRAQLLRALEAMLAEGTSLADITVEALAGRAGISRASFYNYCGDKVELLEDWIVSVRSELLEVTNGWYTASPALTRDELGAALLAIVRAYRSTSTLMLAMHEAALYDSMLRDEFAEAFEVHVGALAAHLAAGQQSGDIVPDLPAPESARWLMCLLERGPMVLDVATPDDELILTVDALTEIVWSALYAGAPSRSGRSRR